MSQKTQQLDLATVLEAHYPRIHRAALLLTGNPWDADDLAQETFLLYARSGERFAGRSQLSTWLYGVLLNMERRRRRRFATDRSKLQILWDREVDHPPTAPPAEAPVEAIEWKRSLWNYVAQLPDGQRQTLVLRFGEQLSYDEIAAALQCPLGTVKSRLFHGLAALRQLIGPQGEATLTVPQYPQEDRKDVV